MKSKLGTAVVALSFAISAATAAEAATLNVSAVEGSFSGATARNGTLSGPFGPSINWGVGAFGPENSGYAFTGAAQSFEAGSFVLGTFEHRNRAIWSNSTILESVSMTVNIAGDLMGQAFNLTRSFAIDHRETLNSAVPCAEGGGNPCGDRVRFGDFEDYSLEVATASQVFTLTIEGWVDILGGSEITSLFTAEGQSSFAYIVGRLEVRDVSPETSQVPLPAGGLLLLGGLGGLALVRRRKAA